MVNVSFQAGTEMTDAQPILSLQPGRVPKVRNQQTGMSRYSVAEPDKETSTYFGTSTYTSYTEKNNKHRILTINDIKGPF